MNLPSYSDYPEELFEERMTGLGFRRSRTDPQTEADGDCALWAVLDGYNNIESNALFDREDSAILRQMVVQSLRTELRRQGPQGDLRCQMIASHNSPEAYLDWMKIRGHFADHIFIQMMASIIQHDIILLSVHPETFPGNYLKIPGGVFGTDQSEPNVPVFVAYFEDSKFSAGHYQAMEPSSNGPVLKDLLTKGGLDIATLLSLPEPVSALCRTTSFTPPATSTLVPTAPSSPPSRELESPG